MSAVLKERERKASPVIEARMKEREHKVTDFVVDVEPDVTPEDLADPSFWAFCAPQLKIGDAIEVRPDDFSWFAFLRVLWADRNFARVVVVNVVKCKLNMEPPPESVKHEVEFKGGTLKWCVIRLSDKAVLQKGLPTKQAANDWLRNHEVTMGV